MEGQSAPGHRRPLVIIPRQVADRFTAEIRGNPRVEVGGKYLGHIRGNGRYRTLAKRQEALRSGLTFEVTDYLEDGPDAERTGTFHRGDAEWQTQEFRRREQQDPELEQLGSWHSHHPNGLGTLSAGDIRGYKATVNDRGHNHDFFFVSLGVDQGGFATAKHYLFIRGDDEPHKLALDDIMIVDGESDRQASSEDEQRRVEMSGQRQSPVEESNQGVSRQLLLPEWSETERGRKVLAHEQECLRNRAFAGIRLSVTQGRLMASGSIRTDEGSARISLLYPSAPDRQDGLLKIATSGQLEIQATVPGELSQGLERAAAVVSEFLQFVDGIRPTGSRGIIRKLRGQ